MENNLKDLNFDTKSNKGPLIGVFLIVLSLSLYSLLVNPLSDKVEAAEADIAAKTIELDEVTKKINEYEKAQEEFELTTEVQRLNSLKAIPLGVEQDEALRDVIEIAESYDIILNSISFGKGSTQIDDINSLRINASFEGNYNDLIDFLEGIEQNARLFIVENISVQVSKLEISNIERASFSLTIQSYFQDGLK